MRRLLSLVVTAGLAMPSAVALADNTHPRPAAQADDAPAMPSFLRRLLERAGVIEPEPIHPWIAWWLDTFRIDPKRDPEPAESKPRPTSSTTASR